MSRSRPRLSAADRLYGRRRRSKPLAKTAARGYGGSHVAVRTTLVAAFLPGQPCAIGGEPLWVHTLRKYGDLLDLAHDHARGGYLGLSCRMHNRGHYDKPAQLVTGRRW